MKVSEDEEKAVDFLETSKLEGMTRQLSSWVLLPPLFPAQDAASPSQVTGK